MPWQKEKKKAGVSEAGQTEADADQALDSSRCDSIMTKATAVMLVTKDEWRKRPLTDPHGLTRASWLQVVQRADKGEACRLAWARVDLCCCDWGERLIALVVSWCSRLVRAFCLCSA